MILSNNLSQKTHYEIIGVKEDASHEEIRKTYRSAILNHHPDKQQQMMSETSSDPDRDLGGKFLDVQRAWEVLSDTKSRALYDDELRALRQDAVTAEDLSLEDMSFEDGGDFFDLYYDCRCGDCYSVESSELEEMGCTLLRNGDKVSLQISGSLPASIVLPCGSCSLKVRLLIDADSTLQTELKC